MRQKVGLLRLPLHQGLYNGTVNGENQPHGFGSIRYLKGDRFHRFNYTGQWHEGGIANGGIIQWNNGARSVSVLRIDRCKKTKSAASKQFL